jgi:hypothetical protein
MVVSLSAADQRRRAVRTEVGAGVSAISALLEPRRNASGSGSGTVETVDLVKVSTAN